MHEHRQDGVSNVTDKRYTLETKTARISVDAEGQLVELTGNGTTWHGTPGPFWELTVQAPSNPSVLGNHRKAVAAAPPVIEKSGKQISLKYVGLVADVEATGVDIEAIIAAENDEFTFSFTVTNQSDTWTVREVRAPMLTVPLPEDRPPSLLWPMGAGERYENCAGLRLLSASYPSRAFVPWMAMDAGASGLYVASHDSSCQAITLNADACRIAGAIQLSIAILPFCEPGETCTTAPLIIRPYAGTWHEAATRYRHWADSWFSPVKAPAWVREATGWQLVILKQQNGEIHWPYTDLDNLIRLGKENGLNVLGLFGWTEGGHDRRYPIYEAEPEMGGEEALRRGIEKAHAAGQKVILYTNGQLRDILTDWHDEFGHASAAISERGDMFGESWVKYRDAPPRRMSYGCQSSKIWSDTLLELAKKLNRLGADGLIFDQLGSCHPALCFSKEHNHVKPSQATGPGVVANMSRVQKEMQAINPDFIVIVEHVADAVNQHVDLTHGCGTGFAPGGRGFPEMLRFTLPEILATQRHPTPVMDRNTANWAIMYGYAHEVEYRYWPDRLYIEKGIIPEFRDYERIGSPPNIALMRSLDPRNASAYLKSVIEFGQRNADLLRDGTFRDILGFEIDNPEVKAKAYVNGDLMGIVLLNPTDEPQPVTVTVPGMKCVENDAPQEPGSSTEGPIPPQSVRLARYGSGEKKVSRSAGNGAAE